MIYQNKVYEKNKISYSITINTDYTRKDGSGGMSYDQFTVEGYKEELPTIKLLKKLNDFNFKRIQDARKNNVKDIMHVKINMVCRNFYDVYERNLYYEIVYDKDKRTYNVYVNNDSYDAYDIILTEYFNREKEHHIDLSDFENVVIMTFGLMNNDELIIDYCRRYHLHGSFICSSSLGLFQEYYIYITKDYNTISHLSNSDNKCNYIMKYLGKNDDNKNVNDKVLLFISKFAFFTDSSDSLNYSHNNLFEKYCYQLALLIDNTFPGLGEICGVIGKDELGEKFVKHIVWKENSTGIYYDINGVEDFEIFEGDDIQIDTLENIKNMDDVYFDIGDFNYVGFTFKK